MAKVRISIVFESGARIGPGKAALLESIRKTGSISAAARDMGMSYKRAWMLLDSINQAFTEPVVTAAPGGAGGGGAVLTPFGAEVLERYRRILDQAASSAGDRPLATAAFQTRAPSRKEKTPCCRAASQIRSTSSCGKITPPARFWVFSISTSVVGG